MARSQEGGGEDYWKHQFFDIEREGNGACGAERMDGSSCDRTKKKKTVKTL